MVKTKQTPRLKTTSGQRGRGRGARGGTTPTPPRGSGRGVRRGGGGLTGPPPVAGGNVGKGRGRGSRGGGAPAIPPHLMRGGPRGSGRTRAASKSMADIMKELVGAANQSPPAAFNPGNVIDPEEEEGDRERNRQKPSKRRGGKPSGQGVPDERKQNQRRGPLSLMTPLMSRRGNHNLDLVTGG